MIDIYTKFGCPSCTWAKNLLQSKGIGFKEHRLGEDFAREFIIEHFPNAKTFPVVIVDGFNVGGYEGLQEYLTVTESPHHNMQFLTE